MKERIKNSTKKAMVALRKHRGFHELLSYLIALDDCTILHKDGAISRHFCYCAPDVDSSTDGDLDYHAQTWAHAFSFLGNGWMVETNVIHQPFRHDIKPRQFPELISALFEDERTMQYQAGHYFKTRYYLSVTWKPEEMLASKLRRFAIEGEKKEESGFDEQLQYFNKFINEYLGFLKRSLVSIEPLKEHELTSFLYQSITGKHQQLVKPYHAAFLDCYLSSEDFIGGMNPSMGKKAIKVLAIDDLPSVSYPCILDELSFFPIEYRWSNRFICLDPLTTKAYLKRYERNWSSKAIGVMGVIRESMGLAAKRDDDAQHMADQLKAAQVENSAGSVSCGFYNSTIVLTHEDREYIDKIAETIQSRIQQLNFRVRDESLNATEAYLGSIPGHGDYNLRKMLVDTNFVGHAFPTSSIYQGEAKAPCPLTGYQDEPALLLTATRGARPFFLNLHIADVGHTAILGPTGKGKSTLSAALMMSHRKYSGSRIIVLDKDYSNRVPIKALGGEYYDLAKAECQLGVLSQLGPNDLEQIDQSMAWLKDVCAVQGVEMTPARHKYLREAVERLTHEPPAYKNLYHLNIQDPALREAMAEFNSGQRALLLNGTSALSSKSDVIGFEMSSLVKANTNERDVCIPVIKAIFNALEDLFKDKRPTLLILEEAWLYLRHPLFREKLTDWFKTLRKANVAVIFISQDLEDITQSDAASVIQTSCMTRIYLPNAAATEPHAAEHYRSFGLNDQQLQMIQQAIPKQDYYYQSQLGNRLFTLDLKAFAKAFLCVSSKDDLKQFDQVCDPANPRWVLDWLAYKNLPDWREFVLTNYFQEQEMVNA